MLTPVNGWTFPCQQTPHVYHPLRHFNISLEHLPYQNSTWFYKSWPIITPIFFYSAVEWRKNWIRWGLHLENKFSFIYTPLNCWVPSALGHPRSASMVHKAYCSYTIQTVQFYLLMTRQHANLEQTVHF